MDRRTLLPGWGLRSVEASDAAVLNALLRHARRARYRTTRSARSSRGATACASCGASCTATCASSPTAPATSRSCSRRSATATRPARCAAAFELMDDYNAAAPRPRPQPRRVRQRRAAHAPRPSRSRLSVTPMGHDYVYDTARMIDLAGGDLASKRQAKNRFVRNYGHRVETYDAAQHLAAVPGAAEAVERAPGRSSTPTRPAPTRSSGRRNCSRRSWRSQHADDARAGGHGRLRRRRRRRRVASAASRSASASARTRAASSSRRPTWRVKGLAQFIFSEFCRLHWSDRPLVNVGDDWGLETLAWTKQCYRPVKLLKKFVLRQERAAMSRERLHTERRAVRRPRRAGRRPRGVCANSSGRRSTRTSSTSVA